MRRWLPAAPRDTDATVLAPLRGPQGQHRPVERAPAKPVESAPSIHSSLRQQGSLQPKSLLQGLSADDVLLYTGADDWGAGGGSSDDDNPEPAETDAGEEAGPSQQAPAAALPEAGGPSQQPASPPARRPRHPAVQRLTKQQSRGSLSGEGNNSSCA